MPKSGTPNPAVPESKALNRQLQILALNPNRQTLKPVSPTVRCLEGHNGWSMQLMPGLHAPVIKLWADACFSRFTAVVVVVVAVVVAVAVAVAVAVTVAVAVEASVAVAGAAAVAVAAAEQEQEQEQERERERERRQQQQQQQ